MAGNLSLPTLEEREWVRQLIHDLQLTLDDLDQSKYMKLVRKAIDALYEGPIKEALMIVEEIKNERISVKVSTPQRRTPNVQASETSGNLPFLTPEQQEWLLGLIQAMQLTLEDLNCPKNMQLVCDVIQALQ